MCMSFEQLGISKAEYEMNVQEQDQRSEKPEIKPFTTKAPVHLIEALDTVASYMNMNRNALVLKLINQYLPQAFISYSIGYAKTVSDHADQQDVLSDLENMLKNAQISDEASSLLQDLIVTTVLAEF